MNHLREKRCRATVVILLAVVVGCGKNPSGSRRERIEAEAQKEYAVDVAGKALITYGGYEKWRDVNVSMEGKTVIVNGLAIRAGAVHDFTVTFEKLESDELSLLLVEANATTLFSGQPASPSSKTRSRAIDAAKSNLSVRGYAVQSDKIKISGGDSAPLVTGWATKGNETHEFRCKFRVTETSDKVAFSVEYIEIDGGVVYKK